MDRQIAGHLGECPAEAGEQTAQDQQPGAHAEKGRITGDKEDVINGDAEGTEEVDPGFNGGNLQSGKLAVQRGRHRLSSSPSMLVFQR